MQRLCLGRLPSAKTVGVDSAKCIDYLGRICQVQRQYVLVDSAKCKDHAVLYVLEFQ